jgi:hypothetical protein
LDYKKSAIELLRILEKAEVGISGLRKKIGIAPGPDVRDLVFVRGFSRWRMISRILHGQKNRDWAAVDFRKTAGRDLRITKNSRLSSCGF